MVHYTFTPKPHGSYGTVPSDPPPPYTPTASNSPRKIGYQDKFISSKSRAVFNLKMMLLLGFIIFVGILVLVWPNFYQPSYVRHVAIIGAGPAGLSAAYHISMFAKSAGIPHKISLYDRESHIGGRAVHRITISDTEETVDIGPTTFPKTAKPLIRAAGSLKVRMDVVDSGMRGLVGKGTHNFGVYEGGDGNSWVYLEPYLKNFITRRWWAIRLWFLYGKSPGSAENLVSSTFSALDRLYSPAFFPFQSISAALRNVGLEEEVTSSADTYLSSKNVDGRFQREIFTPWVRLRHAQNLGTVSALGACMAAADVKPAFTVAGGLQHGLWESMAKRSMAETHLSTRVLGMRKGGWGGWMLATTPSEVSGEYQTDYKPFDAVILATSWVSADLHIQEQPLKNVPQNITYAGIHVTLFTSPYWIAMRDAPASVLTTVRSNEFSNANPHTGEAGQGSVGFWSLHMVREITTESRGREYVYKFISSTPLDDEMIKSWVYGAVTWVHREHLPNVYPLNFPNDLAHTQENEIYVDDGLWYTGAMERFMTGIEMSTLAGMNAARLLVNQWLSEGLHLKEERMIPEWLKNGTAPEPFYTKGKVPTPDSFVDESLTHSPHNPSGKGSRTPEI